MARESSRHARGTADAVPDERVVEIEQELEAWRQRALPDANVPLDADDVARLVRDCYLALALDDVAGDSFSVHTVHYYRRKEILDAPEGRTSAARYTLQHVWQAAGARLAGQLGLLTLAEARANMRGADEVTLRRFVAARVADARGRRAARVAARQASPPAANYARPLRATPSDAAGGMLATAKAVHYASAPASVNVVLPPPSGDFTYPPIDATRAVVLSLGGSALCLIPESHPALRSASAARSLVSALADALGVTQES